MDYNQEFKKWINSNSLTADEKAELFAIENNEEEKALRKREYEKAKRRSDGCSQLIILILGIILLLIAILR